MILGYKVYTTVAIAQAQADALWSRYAALTRTARGLPIGASLDVRRGQRVNPPVTVRYVSVISAGGETRAALRVDDFMAAQQGVNEGGTVIDVASPIAEGSLPARLLARVRI